ncbi:MAG: methyltransferase domain-containing protein [Methanobacterium sp.]|nr:methyltransferase domain-containing protein [Methanobacterium sp.]
MKLGNTPYHHNLTSDSERLAGFFEAIQEKAKGTVFDLGTGSGILSSWAAQYADRVVAVEINRSASKIAQRNLEDFNNVEVVHTDASEYQFSTKADVIICEMLDTALIDEEQIPVLNSALKYLKEDGIIIPCGIINCLEPVESTCEHISYEEDGFPENSVLGEPLFYSRLMFGKHIEPKFKQRFMIKINRKGIVTGLKLTTFTLITEKIICGPTPMLNPPLIIPLKKLKVVENDLLEVNLSYEMGGGLESVRARAEKIHPKP